MKYLIQSCTWSNQYVSFVYIWKFRFHFLVASLSSNPSVGPETVFPRLFPRTYLKGGATRPELLRGRRHHLCLPSRPPDRQNLHLPHYLPQCRSWDHPYRWRWVKEGINPNLARFLVFKFGWNNCTLFCK